MYNIGFMAALIGKMKTTIQINASSGRTTKFSWDKILRSAIGNQHRKLLMATAIIRRAILNSFLTLGDFIIARRDFLTDTKVMVYNIIITNDKVRLKPRNTTRESTMIPYLKQLIGLQRSGRAQDPWKELTHLEKGILIPMEGLCKHLIEHNN